MAAPKAIGYMTCPTCDFPDMEVRRDKNGNPYGYCPDCSQQLLTHGGDKGEKLIARMRPIPPDELAEPDGPAVPATDGEQDEKPPVTVTEEKRRANPLKGTPKITIMG